MPDFDFSSREHIFDILIIGLLSCASCNAVLLDMNEQREN